MELALCLAEQPSLGVKLCDGPHQLIQLPTDKTFSRCLKETLRTYLSEEDPLTLVRLTRGPANFTQLRCGLGHMRALAMACQIPVMAPTLHQFYFEIVRRSQDVLRKTVGIVVRTGRHHESMQIFQHVGDYNADPGPIIPGGLEDCDILYAPEGWRSSLTSHCLSVHELPSINALMLFDLSMEPVAFHDVVPCYIRPPDAVVSEPLLKAT